MFSKPTTVIRLIALYLKFKRENFKNNQVLGRICRFNQVQIKIFKNSQLLRIAPERTIDNAGSVFGILKIIFTEFSRTSNSSFCSGNRACNNSVRVARGFAVRSKNRRSVSEPRAIDEFDRIVKRRHADHR